MLNKGFIKELYKQGYGYAEIAEQVNVSRQRIHQIVKDYKNFGRKDRKTKYRNWGKCKECSNQANVLHHIDFNNKNDELSNLIQLCEYCHAKRHGKTLLTLEQRKQVALDYNNGMSTKEITNKYHISRSVIYTSLKLV